MDFTDIPVRGYGVTDPSWWNALRTAGIRIQGWLGAITYPTVFAIANNQSSAANVTGLSFDGTVTRSFVVDYQIYRNTTGGGATELAEAGQLIGAYKTVGATWEMIQAPVVGDAGVTLSITSAGQVQYASSNITGTAATSAITFKARTTGV